MKEQLQRAPYYNMMNKNNRRDEEMEWFVDSSLDRKALDRFFEFTEENRIEVHTMQIYRGNGSSCAWRRNPIPARTPGRSIP